MSSREELVNQLTEISEENYYPMTLEAIADFIIEDRLRVVGPLVEYNGKSFFSGELAIREIENAVNETLKLAGIGEKE